MSTAEATTRTSVVTMKNQAYFPPERPEIDVCLLCGFEGWACICNPLKPHQRATQADIERARESRLTCAESDGR